MEGVGVKIVLQRVKKAKVLVEGWSLFDRKLQAFTACLEAFSQEELDNLVHELARLDLDLKSSDLKPEILIETFLIKYFALRDKKLG